MAYFPFMIEVEGHKALVVGAGQSAKDKIRVLTDFGALVTVVAPVISADVVKQGKNIKIERRVYRPGETKGYEIVVAATDNPAVNKQVAHDAARFGAICSVSEDPGRGGFVFPKIIKRSTYSVAVCTDGMEEELAEKLIEKISDAVPEKADEIAALFSKARKKLDEQGSQASDMAGKSRMRLADIAGNEQNSAEYEVTDNRIGDGLGERSDTGDTSDDAGERLPYGSIEEGSVIRVGALQDRLSQVRADVVITKLEADGYRCSKVILECPGAVTGRSDEPGLHDHTTIMNSEDALIKNEIDLAVRAAGDLPYDLPDMIAADSCLPREDARDVLVTKKGTGENEVEVIETDSPSRKAQIEKFLMTGEARVSGEGIQAIINRLKAGETDAAVLAASDIEKLLIMEDDELECEYIDVEKSLPSACQGITALETRESGKAHDAAASLNDKETMMSFRAERAFMKAAGATSSDEIAAYSAVNGGKLFMKAMSRVRQKCVYFAGMDDPENGEQLAVQIADKMKAAL